MSKKPKLENLNVLSNFLINAIANDPDICEPFFRLIISILLEIEIGRIIVRAQTFIPGNTPDLRGIQLDVEITEYLDSNEKGANCRIYNVEPQLYPDNLPKRNRFYQAKKDGKGLKSGEKNWNKLPDLYMVTITNYDPFGEDSMVYTFENTCKEFPHLEYKDGLKFIYFNSTGNLNAPKAKKELLTYLNDSRIECVTNDDIAQLHNYVSSVKHSAEVQGNFMTVGEWLDRQVEEEVAARLEEEVAARLEEEVAARLEEEVAARLEEEVASKLEATLSEGISQGISQGEQFGRINSILDALNDLGPVPAAFQVRLQEADEATLKQWNKLAARAEKMEDFWENIGFE